jgi:pentafunctional AROM polypeptide
MGSIEPRSIYLFGQPIQHSLSPALHNSGFEYLGLAPAFKFHLYESAAVDPQMIAILKQTGFGGAAVTIPLKEQMMSHVDQLTDAARSIGALNTIIPVYTENGARLLVGDNTDWLGIRGAIQAALSTILFDSDDSKGDKKPLAIILGAGGTARAACYAIQQMPRAYKQLQIWNRTEEKARQLAVKFNGSLFDSSSCPLPPNQSLLIIIGTVPGDVQPTLAFDLQRLLSSSPAGVYLELAYQPRRTQWMQQAQSTAGWKVVEGVEVLLRQGYQQFQRWTGQPVPVQTMRQSVIDCISQRK